MIRRPPRSTPLYSSAASDVYKRQRSWWVSDRGQEGARVQDAVGVERELDPAHQAQLGRVLKCEKVRLLRGADAVLGRNRPTQGQPGLEDGAHHRLTLLVIGLE